jgi:hypothetical protein
MNSTLLSQTYFPEETIPATLDRSKFSVAGSNFILPISNFIPATSNFDHAG